jgi:hypothetical protein
MKILLKQLGQTDSYPLGEYEYDMDCAYPHPGEDLFTDLADPKHIVVDGVMSDTQIKILSSADIIEVVEDEDFYARLAGSEVIGAITGEDLAGLISESDRDDSLTERVYDFVITNARKQIPLY